MISTLYRLKAPGTISVDFKELDMSSSVIIRPDRMSICHADQRYFRGLRPESVLKKKLPMCIIHEAAGYVVHDPTETFKPGDFVAMVPNCPGEPKEDIFENYQTGSGFLSSGLDGFTRELVDLSPDRVVAVPDQGPALAFTEMASVAIHAITRWQNTAHRHRGHVAIWGDGNLSYILASTLRALISDIEITIVGRHLEKLAFFTMADHTCLTDKLTATPQFDHCFECTGGEGSRYAIDQIIDTIMPQGSIVLMGVSEYPVAINTRMVLEKGLTLIGSSRSGRADFEEVARLYRTTNLAERLNKIVNLVEPVRAIDDISRAFLQDLETPFKTVFEWRLS